MRDSSDPSDVRSTQEPEFYDEQWRVRWHDYVPAAALVLLLTFIWLTHTPGEMASWGVSAAALGQGRYATIPLHMFAHGGFSHIVMNSLALLEIGGLVTARLGSFSKGWTRTLLAYVLAGLSSMIFYVSFHPQGAVPMIGASGAIYGLVGLLLGIRLMEDLEHVELRNLGPGLVDFVRNNALFLALLLIGGMLAGIGGHVAWEAHLGGFLFGLCVGPWLLPPLRSERS